jgi:hypothetical protein
LGTLLDGVSTKAEFSSWNAQSYIVNFSLLPQKPAQEGGPKTHRGHCDLHCLALEVGVFEQALGKRGGMADFSVFQHGYKLAHLLSDKWDFYRYFLPACNNNKPVPKPQQSVTGRWQYTGDNLVCSSCWLI